MGNSLGLWSGPSPEEQIIQNHHNDLQRTIINPLDVASKLVQEGVVSSPLVSEVSTQGRSQLQNSTAIITAVTASIHSNPDQFQVFVSVLEDSPESANLATRMRDELSELWTLYTHAGTGLQGSLSKFSKSLHKDDSLIHE